MLWSCWSRRCRWCYCCCCCCFKYRLTMIATFQYHNSWTHQIQFMIKLSDVFIKCFSLFIELSKVERESEKEKRESEWHKSGGRRGIKRPTKYKWQTWCIGKSLTTKLHNAFETFIQCRRKVLDSTEKFRLFSALSLSFIRRPEKIQPFQCQWCYIFYQR